MRRCVIITSFQSASLKESWEPREDDFIICADGGYVYARKENILPDAVIGDFDSIDYDAMENDLIRTGPKDCLIIRVAAEKDDTDTMICLKYGMDQGFEDFLVLGGLGGRLDHTMANLQTMCFAVEHEKSIWFMDGKNKATMRNPGCLSISKQMDAKISLFSFGESCEGVTISGVKYPLVKHHLVNHFPLGVSNEFVNDNAEIRHEAGKLLVILSQD